MKKCLQKNDSRRAHKGLKKKQVQRRNRLLYGRDGRYYNHSIRHPNTNKGPSVHSDAWKRWLEFQEESRRRWEEEQEENVL